MKLNHSRLENTEPGVKPETMILISISRAKILLHNRAMKLNHSRLENTEPEVKPETMVLTSISIWYQDSAQWKPFHHDAGDERDVAFEHTETRCHYFIAITKWNC